jgi:reverse transcriptase-like protein
MGDTSNLKGTKRKYLNDSDPFPDEEEAAKVALAAGELPEPIRPINYAIDTGDKCQRTKQGNASPEWPICAELEQLEHMGMSHLVKAPANAIPIANKWVFAKKTNKQGELTKYEARLVAKGCAQRPAERNPSQGSQM